MRSDHAFRTGLAALPRGAGLTRPGRATPIHATPIHAAPGPAREAATPRRPTPHTKADALDRFEEDYTRPNFVRIIEDSPWPE
ncbi:hypothetical protein [Streptomyces sp. NPDC015125]|uniref:hypothetical protein n=1 Tax=Streptomyces sp. NPDC015125 TaxID=3364938 RepID=UPI003700D239